MSQAQVHRTILVVDVERFGDRHRTNQHQVVLRKGLYAALRQAFHGAGIQWSSCYQEDRGDGVLILAPPDIPKGPFVDALPHTLAKALHEYNRTRPVEQRIRLRMALHAGEISYDDYGVTSVAINLAFRLLDAAPVKAALADSPGVLAVIVSSWFYDEVVRQCGESDHATYRPVQVVVKETSTVGWVCLPDHPYPPDDSPALPVTGTAAEPASRRPVWRATWLQIIGFTTAVLILSWAGYTFQPSTGGAGEPAAPPVATSTAARLDKPPTGDFTIGRMPGDWCLLRSTADGSWDVNLWFQLGWAHPDGSPAPASKVRLTTDVGNQQDWTFDEVRPSPFDYLDTYLDPDERYLDRVLRVTVTIDPDDTVSETVETNNTVVLVIDLRTTLPPPSTNKPVDCQQE